MLEAVLFDIDGTLIDSNDLHVAAWRQAFAEHGHDIAADAILEQIGKGGDKLAPALLPHANDHERKAIADRHGAVFKDRYLDRARPFAGARELLARVHAEGRKVVLASSAKQDELDHYVRLMEIGDLVDVSTSSDDADQSKPAPDIFAIALDKAKVPASRALVVGDTVWDIEAASKNGLRTIGLLSGGISVDKLREAGAIAVYRDAANLLARYQENPLVEPVQAQTD